MGISRALREAKDQNFRDLGDGRTTLEEYQRALALLHFVEDAIDATAEERLARIVEWTHAHGAALCLTAGSADTFGDGMRAAKKQVAALAREAK